MWFVICWLALGVLFIGHARIRRRWVTGLTAFTGVWFASLTALFVFPDTWDYISREAAEIVICIHLSFFLGSWAVYILYGKRQGTPLKFAPTARTKKALVYLCWILLLIGVLGGWFAVTFTGSFDAYQEGTLASTRSMLLTQEMQLPTSVRLMCNLLYPASLLGAMCFLVAERSLRSWLYIVLPVVGCLLYGFAFGGRGAIMITAPMIIWVLAIEGTILFGAWRDRFFVIAALSALVLFIGIMAGTRMDSSLVGESILQYFTGPIPSFSEWLNSHPFELINVDFSNLAIVREVMRLFGSTSERAIGMDVVFVPFRFNVFTHIAEHVRDFGLIGALVVSCLLGILTSTLESRRQSAAVLGVRATIYGYLSFSLFADVAFFVVGWWLALLMIIFVVPLLARLLSTSASEKTGRLDVGSGLVSEP
jgi:oligosaccharide repeat unit polymerase